MSALKSKRILGYSTINNRARRQAGYSTMGLVGKHFQKDISPPDAPAKSLNRYSIKNNRAI